LCFCRVVELEQLVVEKDDALLELVNFSEEIAKLLFTLNWPAAGAAGADTASVGTCGNIVAATL
jgi:hypothetical protein